MCRPSDFPCDVQAVTCSGNGGNHQIHHTPLVIKGYIVPCVEVAGNLADLFRADGFHRQLRYPRQKFLLAPVQFRYLHIHIGEQDIVCTRQTVHQLFNLAVHMEQVPLAVLQFSGLSLPLSFCLSASCSLPVSLPSADKQPLPVPK